MAYTRKGFLGEFQGRIRNMVIYQMNGKTIVRNKPSGRRGPASPALQAAQGKFARVMNVVQGVKPFLQAGFRDVAGGRYVFQRALSENLARYDQSAAPETLDWLTMSLGERAGARDLILTIDGNTGQVSWGEPEEGKPYSATDQVLMLALNTTTLDATDNYNAGQRSKGQATIKLPPVKEDEKIRVYVAFRDLEGTNDGYSLNNISSSQTAE
ncbi:MAG: DUF6266 family protein [Bacteroides sp.]|nr:DUF6266 family protein [Bacteroides sp.]